MEKTFCRHFLVLSSRGGSSLTFCSLSKYGSVQWANEQLRFAIKVLQGKSCGRNWKGNLQVALMVRDRLYAARFLWQAERIDNWIHRLQPRKVDSREIEGERVS